MKYDTATPYIATGLIFRKDNKIAFVLRGNTDWMNGYYSFPGGKVEKKESFTAAAIREVEEEVGVKLKEGNLEFVLACQREHPDYEWVDIIFEVKDWQGKLYNAEPDLHDELVWLDVDNLPENMIPHVLFYLEQIKAGKTYVEYTKK